MEQEEEIKWEAPEIPRVPDPLDARRKPYKRRTWEVKTLMDQHHEVIRRLLIGQKTTAIAQEMNLSKAQVQNIENSPLVQQRISVLQGVRDQVSIDVSKHIRSVVPKALLLLEKIVDGDVEGEKPSLNLRASVSRDLLDRGGLPKQTNVRTENLHAHLTVTDLDEIKMRAKERVRLVPVAKED